LPIISIFGIKIISIFGIKIFVETPLSARAGLLQALRTPGYGLDLIERVRRASGGRVRLRVGSVYPALLSLERAGLVRHRLVVARRRGRPRRYYELTVLGARAAMEDREALLGLLGGPPVSEARDEVGPMRERLQSCSDVSLAVWRLQRGLQAGKGRARKGQR
jgi:PadR family transcriptional regulator PadR